MHDPVAAGDCRSCHDPALAAAPPFLAGAPPAGGKVGDVALCAACHPEQGSAEGGAATRFAAGSRDLHALHVRASQERGCLTCHDAHAAPQPHLLRTEIPARGGVRIRQRFREEARGGWCQTGCHAPKRYAR